ncbi:MAG: ArsR family transcriptional regulator, partial [Gemmatimonadetes bacterium]|nr:ArsR family transcriptional regulator [Gemmatimonadota bacterium]
MEGPIRGRIDTRTEILRLLCTANRTVTDLAQALGISRNAVREHLERLAEEELVRHEVVRRGVGKPAHEYELTSGGELALSRAYLPILRQLLHVLEGQLPAEAVEAMLRLTGQHLAPS